MRISASGSPRIDWINVIFLLGTALVALTVQPLYIYFFGLSWGILAVFFVYLIATGLAITAGYHRLFAHRSYRANRSIKLFYLLFGAAACQNSALKWSSDHRKHHAYTEQDQDPYNINKGFLYAHIGWIFYKDFETLSLDNVRDLSRDPLVAWQDRYYVLLAVMVGGVIPLLVGYFLGDAWGCLILAGVTRTVIVHHATFLINSVCHLWGERPYSLRDTARDNLIVALLTHGEGYHNFHHQFPYDYRNGFRWFHWDPTKWFIRALEMAGCVDQIRRARNEQIFKAMVQVQKFHAQQELVRYPMNIREAMETRLHASYETLIKLRTRWEQLKTEYRLLLKSGDERCHSIAASLRHEIQLVSEQFHMAQEAWLMLIQGPLQEPT